MPAVALALATALPDNGPDSIYRHHLRDLGQLLLDLTLDAKRERGVAVGSENEALALGRLMPLFEIVSLMLDRRSHSIIPTADISLAGIDPEP